MHHNHISWVTATCNASIWIDSTKWMRQGTGIRQELLITIRALTQRITVDYYFVTHRVICKFIRIRKSRTAFIFKGNNSFQTLATNESVLCDEADCFMSDTTGDNMTHVLKSFTFCFIVSYVMQLNVLGRMELYTNRPLNVFYCPGGLLKNISDIDQQLCTRHCLFHPAFRVLSYNQRDRFCMLGEIPCNVAENHTGYMLMVFKPSVSEDCIIWKSDPLPSRTVDSHLGDHEALCRKNIETSILIGHGKHSERAKFVENGKLIKGTFTLCPCQNPFQYPLQFPCPSHRLHWIRIPVSFRLNFMSTTASPDVKVWFCIGTCKIRMETDVRISFSRSGDRSKRNGR